MHLYCQDLPRSSHVLVPLYRTDSRLQTTMRCTRKLSPRWQSHCDAIFQRAWAGHKLFALNYP